MRALLAAAVLVLPSAPAAAQLPDYTGRWVPKELVDSAGREITDTTIVVRQPSRAFPNRRLDAEERRQLQILVGMAQPSRSIVFAADDSLVVVTYNDEITFRLRPNGPAVLDTLGETIPLSIQARWADGTLRIEFEPEGGGTYSESYALADSRLFMRVDARLEWGKLRTNTGWSEMYRKVPGAR